LRFDLTAAQKLDIGDLHVVSAERLRSSNGLQVLRDFGPWAARFLVAHKISLFRIGVLLGTARSHVRKAEEILLQKEQKEIAAQASASIGLLDSL
jgi:hypothetical protein